MRSLYGKFVAVTIGTMFLSGVLSFILSNAYYQHQLKPYNDQKNTNIALQIATFANEHPTINLNEYLRNISAIGYQIYLVTPTGEETFFGTPFRDKSLPDSIKNEVLKGMVYHGILHFPQETFVTGFFANELKNTIGMPFIHSGQSYALFLRPDIGLLFHEMRVLFGWLIFLTIILSILLIVIYVKYLVEPILKLTKATKLLSQGDFQLELDITRRDELGELSQNFSNMANKLGKMEEMRKELISNISHDIQSPLSNIKGYTNLLEKESISLEERSQYVSIINGEIRRLSSLTKQLLLLASLDRNENRVSKTRFNVGQQIKELIRSYQWLISEKGIMLGYSLPDTEIEGDPSLLHTVWDNLLINAIKYNKSDGSIEISIENKGDNVLITFADTGIGLNQMEIERVFDRFFRADTSRSRTIEGTGLGLSIVSTIVKLHGGKIYVDSKEKEGTSFMIELPNS